MQDYQNKNSQSSGGFSRNPQRQDAAGGRQRDNSSGGRQRDNSTGGRQWNDTTGGRQQDETPRHFKDDYKSQWITSAADNALVDYAEKAGKFMARKELTNSKIRSIYGEIKRIQMSEFENEKSAFILLKPKVAYALGRDERNEGLKLFKEIFDLCFPYVTNQKSFQNFCNFMEAILAYHKAYGGKD